MPKYPEITVQLAGEDGNAFFILGRVLKEMRRAHVAKEEIDEFLNEAQSENYDHLLQTIMNWVETS